MNKFKLKKIFPYLIIFLLAGLFVFLRFYQINKSLFFSNDIGRDFLVFWRWQNSGKPPLLGPQNSALPFNQSAIYFYLLYPFYLIFAGSEYATIIAGGLIYLSAFFLGLYLLRNKKQWQSSLLILFFLITIHPQYISQTRYIWNPSFVGPSIILAFYSFLFLRESFKKNQQLNKLYAWLLSLALALALAFSYSAFPTVVAFLLMAMILFKKNFYSLLFKFLAANALVNLPTIVFELRHNFLLSKMLLFREKLAQPNNNILDKISSLQQFIFALPLAYSLLLLLFLIILIGYLYKKEKKMLDSELGLGLALFFLSLIIIFLSPFGVQAHYIFGPLSLFLMILAFMTIKNRFAILAIVFLSFFWLNPNKIEHYFAPAPHTATEVKLCAQQFCEKYPQAMFAAIQSAFHPYHNATEWQYLLPSNGCLLKDLVTQTGEAEYMAMIVEYSQYEHGKTAFNELTIFGPSQEIDNFICKDNLEIRILKKIKNK